MPSTPERDATTAAACRVSVLVLVIAALGLPVNDLARYGVLLLGAIAVFSGSIWLRPARWFAAMAILAVSVTAQSLWPAPRIEEGHNVFIVDKGAGNALERGLPTQAYRLMAAEFNARYPEGSRCDRSSTGCWRGEFPAQPYAFSADAIYDSPAYSRRVTGIDFSDPVWLRLGFINEGYNWHGASDLQRNNREPRWKLLHPWALTMPYFVMVRFPSEFAGSRLCWRGLLLWEGRDGAFEPLRRDARDCRTIEAGDAGRMIFGVAIASPLAMKLEPTWAIRLRGLATSGLALAAAAAIVLLLVRLRLGTIALPMILIGAALLVVFIHDASFIGGWRPFDGGDDGLVYEKLGRTIAQNVLNGNYAQALEGGEKVFYYGGPGLRYLRALERFICGDTFLGYLSLILFLPLAVYAAIARFLGQRTGLALTLVFILIPVGALFGTSYFHYVKWAARGFADPAAATCFIAALVCLVGRADGANGRFAPAFGAGLLFALALWIRPNLAPGAGILLGGAGLAALCQWQIARVAGLCIGVLPVLGMAFHNWYFGGVFVLFSSNAAIPEAVPMPPSAYLAALGELLRLDVGGEHLKRGILQWGRWLVGPSESFAMIPLHVVAVAILIRVALSRIAMDPWIRLIAAATLVQHTVAWFYLSNDRYYHLAWLLTLLVVAMWVRDEGLFLLKRFAPRTAERLERSCVHDACARMLDRMENVVGLQPARR